MHAEHNLVHCSQVGRKDLVKNARQERQKRQMLKRQEQCARYMQARRWLPSRCSPAAAARAAKHAMWLGGRRARGA